MSSCYFANAAYGIILSGDARGKFDYAFRGVHKVLCREHDDFGDLSYDDQVERVLAYLKASANYILEEVREQAGAPPDAGFHWTGHEDERPGESQTVFEEWVLGYGLLAFPRTIPDGFPKFSKRAEWHTWVTASV